MEILSATRAFTALGHPGRLAVFRLLVRFAPQGARPTEIASALGLKQNTLSHHLADLVAAGLIRGLRHGRSILYSIDPDHTRGLVGYLIDDCCRGRPELCTALPSAQPARDKGPFEVLFLCSANSARSLFAEAILNTLGKGRFRAHSAGTRPGKGPHPMALQILQRNGIDTTHLRPKPVSDFDTPDAPAMDFVFTVCDNAASEDCAPWPGQPMTAHWGIPDPVKAIGTDAERALAFATAYVEPYRRIATFVALPLDQLDRLAIQRRIDALATLDLASRPETSWPVSP